MERGLASRKGRPAGRNAGTGPRVGVEPLRHESERGRLTAALTDRTGTQSPSRNS